ncbi:hypothetical protein [Mucilaginibacter pineti]|uniref:hypothetical protein n=1 Tax=Mucilaginibacter pineti TaxID=1391627 RepID=UPI0013BEA8E5|nr:hypothetical protein [Mucilaginibacter pineti]
MKNGIVATYPSLQQNLQVDVAIMSPGIGAALMVWHLCNSRLKLAKKNVNAAIFRFNR